MLIFVAGLARRAAMQPEPAILRAGSAAATSLTPATRPRVMRGERRGGNQATIRTAPSASRRIKPGWIDVSEGKWPALRIRLPRAGDHLREDRKDRLLSPSSSRIYRVTIGKPQCRSEADAGPWQPPRADSANAPRRGNVLLEGSAMKPPLDTAIIDDIRDSGRCGLLDWRHHQSRDGLKVGPQLP